MKENQSSTSMLNRSLRSDAGSMIFAMVIALAIFVSSFYVLFSQNTVYRVSDDARIILQLGIKTRIHSITSILDDQESFIKSVKLVENGNLWRCINDPEFDCAVAGAQPFYLTTAEQAAGQFYVNMDAGSGLNYQMQNCTGYPSTTCPYRYELTWTIDCRGNSPCNSPDILINGALKMANPNNIRAYFNASTFDFTYRIR